MFRKIVFVTMFSLFALCFQQAQGMDSRLPKGDNLTFHNIESIECLALNIYFEARTESVAGQAAVADVVIAIAVELLLLTLLSLSSISLSLLSLCFRFSSLKITILVLYHCCC